MWDPTCGDKRSSMLSIQRGRGSRLFAYLIGCLAGCASVFANRLKGNDL